MPDYVHGYSERENTRLFDQADTLTELLHGDTRYPADSTVLEAGCGVGAQTVILAKNSPEARFTSVDISETSLRAAEDLIRREKISNVDFRFADVYDLPFKAESFDHVFVCFVLEHLAGPVEALIRLKSVLKKGGSITVIEGDHGSAYFHPISRAASRAIQCLVDIQARLGGNALVGRQLFPLLKKAGFDKPNVSPRMVYADSSRPEWVEGFTKNTFTAMVEGVREQALDLKLIDAENWEKGIADLYATTEEDGVFCYTFFKGWAVR
jgi:ubiquinone/menaquinone biosynthesis C-methylase UbiE